MMSNNGKTLSTEDVTRILWDLYGVGKDDEDVPCIFADENEDLLLFYWAGLEMNDQLLSEAEIRRVEEHISHCEACGREREQRRHINRGEPLIKFNNSRLEQGSHTKRHEEPSGANWGVAIGQNELTEKTHRVDFFPQERKSAAAPKAEVSFLLGNIQPSQFSPLRLTLGHDKMERSQLSIPVPEEAAALFSGWNKLCRFEIAVEGVRVQLRVRVPPLVPEQPSGTAVHIKIVRTDEMGRGRPEMAVTGRAGSQWGPYKLVNFSPSENWHVQMVVSKGSDLDANNNQ